MDVTHVMVMFWRNSMKKLQIFLIVALLLSIVACTNIPTAEETAEVVETTPTLPNPQVHITPAADTEEVVAAFMDAWQIEDYPAMYAMLTANSRGSIGEEDFTNKYLEAAVALTLKYDPCVEYGILSTLTNPDSATATVQVDYNTNLFGELSREVEVPLVKEAGDWFIQWDESVIMPELSGGNTLEIVRETPSRGNIYASDGSPIVAQEDIVAIGFVPGDLDVNRMSLFYSTMAELTIYQIDELIEMVDNAMPNDYISLGEVPQEEVDRRISTLNGFSGVYLNYYTSRFYYDGGIAPQAVGHMVFISDMNTYLRMGYAPNERYGATGLEDSFEEELSGEKGASLYLKDASGQIISKLAEKNATNGQSITTTIDYTLQYLLQQSLGDYRGAIVVVEVDTGKVIAMVSNPPFDPNLFDPANENANPNYTDNPYDEAGNPVFNRATNGQYPLGSVFKIITMAAALETGVFTEESEIYCGHSIEVCGNVLYDWTYEKEKPPSGDLTLPEGLMRSCNPWFYHIGETLYLEGYTNAIADLARGFGLGSITGIEISEQPGNIPVETNTCETATQLAFGQGEMTVTPLQVARYIAALGNGGTLYRPTLIEAIEAETVGTLPISEENFAIIKDAMLSVIKDGRGTAHAQLATLPYRVYGKTGTATNTTGESHAWFGGYTEVNDPEHPDIAIAVILENAGEGSEMAAPVFRRVVSLYFSDYIDVGYILPWEAKQPYVVASPTPEPTETPYGWEGTTSTEEP
jgi:cell division protein FtsI/penicillin-binding protein 2